MPSDAVLSIRRSRASPRIAPPKCLSANFTIGKAPESITPISPTISSCRPIGAIPGISVTLNQCSIAAEARSTTKAAIMSRPTSRHPRTAASRQNVRRSARIAATANAGSPSLSTSPNPYPITAATVKRLKGAAMMPATRPRATSGRLSSEQMESEIGSANVMMQPNDPPSPSPESIAAS